MNVCCAKPVNLKLKFDFDSLYESHAVEKVLFFDDDEEEIDAACF